jgi:hypothetical protein
MSPSSPTRREALAAFFAAPVAGLAASPTQWTLEQASQQIRAKKISPVELTRACLDRIEVLNPRLNAFITVMAERALAQARALETELHNGKWRSPLHGIPIGLKDLFDTAGVKTTCASAVFADRIPAEDAEVVGRLKRAGPCSSANRTCTNSRWATHPWRAISALFIILGILSESREAPRVVRRLPWQPSCVLQPWAPIPAAPFASRQHIVESRA